ncbi:TetR family transcriptional regulator [Nocardia veterana]|uniref:TetR family transcriptional regulator n=2 Tax=Nocardia veterana TaxID=132249 RepID=A0A7X6LZ75_9NOCA|nr:TetR family transcriptional regulator [Nocardia veterana]
MRDNRYMSAESKAPARAHSGATASPRVGLRERKKQRTRRTIRTEALKLFQRQGYSATTIEQIAEAADVSPSTFFRYFPSKEQLVLADDIDPIMIRAIESQPPELAPLEAFRQAMKETFDQLDPQDWQFEQDRMKLIYNEPELRSVIMQETERNVDLIAGLLARRIGREADDFEVRTFSGAMIGAMMTAFGREGLDLEKVDRIADFLAAGMPLEPAPKTTD